MSSFISVEKLARKIAVCKIFRQSYASLNNQIKLNQWKINTREFFAGKQITEKSDAQGLHLSENEFLKFNEFCINNILTFIVLITAQR